MQRGDIGKGGSQPSSDVPCLVSTRVVNDTNDGVEGERLVEVGAQAADARLQNMLLVVDRNDQFNDRRPAGPLRWRSERLGQQRTLA